MSFGLLTLGVQAAQAYQSGLSVTGNNISNVNTAGYTRQVPNFQSQEGGGVRQDPTQRMADQYLTQRLWSDNSRFEAAQAYEQMSSQLDNLVASNSLNLSTSMDDYSAALQTANDDPTSLSSRDLFVAQADSVVKRFNELYTQISQQKGTLNTRIGELTSKMNTYAGQIADLNGRIQIAQANGKESYELQDQRDEAVKQLSSIADVQVVNQANGDINLFIGNGQPLVLGQNASQTTVKASQFDPATNQVGVVVAGKFSDITDSLSGGELGGLLEYRKDTLNKSLDELGRVAITFADTMNAQQQKGMDLNGDMGVKMYRDINDQSLMKSRFQAANATGTVQITDSSQLQASDYQFVMTSDSTFRLTRASDGKSWTQDDFSSVSGTPTQDGELNFDPSGGQLALQIDGMRVTASETGGFSTNEKFQIRPTRTAADDIGLNISDGRDLALASPVIIDPASGNTGTASLGIEVSQLADTSATDPRNALPDIPITLNYSSSGGWTTSTSGVSVAVDPSNANALLITDSQGSVLTADISGVPSDGDQFNIGYNFDVDSSSNIVNVGSSDNRNGLLMAQLMKQSTSLNGSYQDAYSHMVERIGTDTKVAQLDLKASQSVLDNTKAQREAVSGVNLDEEAVKLMQFQQAYQASAQIISVSQRIFDSLLQAV